METGICIRAKVGGRWGSLDIGDPRLKIEDLTAWLMSLDHAALLRTILVVLQRQSENGNSGNVKNRRG